MTPKQYLIRYKSINTEINAMLEEQARLRECAERVSPSQRVGGHGGSQSDRVGINVAKIIDLERAINAKIDELVAARQEIENVISRVDNDTLRVLLRLRYLSLKTWEQTACIMNYSYMQTCRLHGKALAAVKDVIECYTDHVI